MTKVSDALQLDPTGTYTWRLFVDWCSATGHVALPAQPETVAEFVADHPARAGTHRRRITAINSAHRQGGHPEPGRAHAVHAAMASHRHERLCAISDLLDDRIGELPANGWPAGLFGRRDSLILTLVRAGLAYAEIASLRRGEVRRQGQELVIDAARQWRLNSGIDIGIGIWSDRDPVAVYTRWARVQEILDGFPNNRTLAHYFTHPLESHLDRPSPVLDARVADQPLVVRIDRWGYTPLRPTSMSAQSIALITRAQLSGQAATHDQGTRRPGADFVRPDRPAGAMDQPVALDPRYHRQGVTARRRAHAWLTSIGDELDGVTNRAEELLEQLAQIVGDTFPPAPDEI